MSRFILVIELVLGVIAGIIALEGCNLWSYLGFSAFTITVFVPFFASLAVWKFKDLMQVWRDSFSKDKKSMTIKTSLKILDFNERLFYLTGFICLILGIVLILSTISDLSKLARGFAYSLNGLLYGLFFAAVTRILKARIIDLIED